MAGRTTLRKLAGAVVALALSGGGVCAQDAGRLAPIQSPVLTIDSEKLFEQSNFGRATIADIDDRGNRLASENRQIEEDLSAEEKELTDRRQGMPPSEFRALADAFDDKVQRTRRQQDGKTRELNNALEEARVVFLNAAAPVLEQLMRESGAAVVLERRSVFISSNAVDITRAAIDRINEVLASDAPGAAE